MRRGLDLIEIVPDAEPPVCRIMDFGKFRYQQQKKAKQAAKKSKQGMLKSIRVRPNTGDHDIKFKMRLSSTSSSGAPSCATRTSAVSSYSGLLMGALRWAKLICPRGWKGAG